MVPAILAAVYGAASCTSVARITNLNDPACQTSLETELVAVLLGQGETPENSIALAQRTATILTVGDLGSRPFLVASS